MAVVAKWLTHRIVAPTFVGSIPIGRLLINGVWPSGKAPDFDSVIRWFESSYPSREDSDICLGLFGCVLSTVVPEWQYRRFKKDLGL